MDLCCYGLRNKGVRRRRGVRGEGGGEGVTVCCWGGGHDQEYEMKEGWKEGGRVSSSKYQHQENTN